MYLAESSGLNTLSKTVRKWTWGKTKRKLSNAIRKQVKFDDKKQLIARLENNAVLLLQ